MLTQVTRSSVAVTATIGVIAFVGACGSGDSDGDNAKPKPSVSVPGAQSPVSLDGKTPEQVLSATKDALASAQSVHVRALIGQGSERIKLNMKVGANASDGTFEGTLTGTNVAFRIRRVGEQYFLRGKPAMWRKLGGKKAARKLGKNWVEIPANPKLDQLKAFATLDGFSKLLTVSGNKKISQGKKTKKIRGQEAVFLFDGESRLFIAASGKPYPLKIVPTKPAVKGEKLLFTHYDAPLNITPPPNAVKPEPGVIGA